MVSADFWAAVETGNVCLDVELFEAIHRSFMDSPKFCINWADFCVGFLAKIWRQLSYGLLNQANRLLTKTMQTTMQVLVKSQLSSEVCSIDLESSTLRRSSQKATAAVDYNES